MKKLPNVSENVRLYVLQRDHIKYLNLGRRKSYLVRSRKRPEQGN